MNVSELIGRSVYSMTNEELQALQEHYETHNERYKHLERITSIERAITRLSEKTAKEPAWMELAREDKATKKKWLSSGASFKSRGIFVNWSYAGKRFYQWQSGVHVNDEIHRLRQADEILNQMIKEEGNLNDDNDTQN